MGFKQSSNSRNVYIPVRVFCFRNRNHNFPSCLTRPSLDPGPHLKQTQVSPSIFSVERIFSFPGMNYLEKSIGIKSFNTNQASAELSPIIIPPPSVFAYVRA